MTTQQHHNIPKTLPPTNRFTILVVDDEVVLRTLICRALGNIGYVTVQADGPEHALELLKSGEVQPDLIVSDVEMPVMTGVEMVSQIRMFGGPVSELPIIVASGNPSPEMGRAALDAGADRFMTKPFELGDLYAEVGGLLRESQNKARRNEPSRAVSGLAAANRLDVDHESKKVV